MNTFDSDQTYQVWKDFIEAGKISKEVIRKEIVESWKRTHHLQLKTLIINMEETNEALY